MSLPDAVYATVLSKNCAVNVFLNGAPFYLTGVSESEMITWPVEAICQHGQNRIDFEYEPVDFDKEDYTPHEGVQVELSLEVSGKGEITALLAGWSGLDARMVPLNKTLIGGTAPVWQNGPLRAGPGFTVTSAVIPYDGETSGPAAERLSSDFFLESKELGVVAWAGCEPLADGEELRRALYAALQKLHDIVSRGDVKAFTALAEPALRRSALILGYDNIEALANRIFALAPMGGAPGSQMEPMPTWQDFLGANLRWGSTGQLVAPVTDVIRYVDAATGERTGGMRMFFARKPGAPLMIYYSLDNGH